jgi:hypothetical protein
MNEQRFSELMSMVKPLIENPNTVMGESVTAEERLIVTLRFLATGRKYADMKYSSAISPQMLSSTTPETCEAVCQCLKQYVKVSGNKIIFFFCKSPGDSYKPRSAFSIRIL